MVKKGNLRAKAEMAVRWQSRRRLAPEKVFAYIFFPIRATSTGKEAGKYGDRASQAR